MSLPGASADSILFRAIIEYDGTDLLGFQFQKQGRTVQGEIERALLAILRHPIRVTGAGRTDAGVHASGQVISFRAPWKHSLAAMHRALDAHLTDDIAIRLLDHAPPTFHPRFTALKRTYRYQIGIWQGHAPLRARYAWELGPELNVEAMNQAAAQLLGTHDFATFGQPTQGDSTTRHLFQARWRLENPYLYFDICANAFLRRMVRTIVATLVQVGQGRMKVEAVDSILEQRNRSLSAAPAPPQGLILTHVLYPPDSEFDPKLDSIDAVAGGFTPPARS